MDHAAFIDLLKNNRVIAAVKDFDSLEKVIQSRCQIIFVLHGNIINIADIVLQLKRSGKLVLVHIDLIDGLSSREVAVDYIAKNTKADGIISTRPNIIKSAQNYDLLTVQRFFVLDSLALNNISKQLSNSVDAIEILPGIIPKIIRTLTTSVGKPIIAGGLINEKEDIIDALKAGASAISSSNQHIWQYTR